MKKEIWLLGALGLIMVILIGILIFVPAKPKQNTQTQTNVQPPVVAGLQIISPKANEEISSPVKITGIVSGNGWGGFEGQVGTVRLLDSNGKQLGQTAILQAKTDWMTSPVIFEANLDFISPVSQNGSLVFRNENPSDMRDKDKTFILPVKLK
jgi:hypothetical protein